MLGDVYLLFFCAIFCNNLYKGSTIMNSDIGFKIKLDSKSAGIEIINVNFQFININKINKMTIGTIERFIKNMKFLSQYIRGRLYRGIFPAKVAEVIIPNKSRNKNIRIA